MIEQETLHKITDSGRTIAAFLTFITFQVLSIWTSFRYIILVPQPEVDAAVSTSVALESQLIYMMGVSGVFIVVQLIGMLLVIGLRPEILGEYQPDTTDDN